MFAVNQKNRQLPGIRFETVAPAREEVLPRMDIILFVGFAAGGPVGVPVVVESAEQFQAIFGDDLPLVPDKEKGALIYANLAPAVRAFFRNGGKRCWILRVARLQTPDKISLNHAAENFFPLAGFARAEFDDIRLKNISPAFARARSKGSWSDDLQIGTAVFSAGVKLIELLNCDAGRCGKLEIGANESLATGDLLRVFYPDETLLLEISEIIDIARDKMEKPPAFGKRIVHFSARRFISLKELSNKAQTPQSHEIQVEMWTRQRRLSIDLTPSDFLLRRAAVLTLEKPQGEKNPLPTIAPQSVRLKFTNLAAADVPPEGSLLLTNLKGETVAMQVATIIVGTAEKQGETEIICRAVCCQRKEVSPKKAFRAERLTFQIRVQKADRTVFKLGDLAFNAGHRRFWGNLPTDEERFDFFNETGGAPTTWTPQSEIADIPLAGAFKSEAFYFPLFAAALPENYLGAIPLKATKIQRDGLEVFDENLFLDAALKETGSAALLNEAEAVRYTSRRPRALVGIHAALLPETVSHVRSEISPIKSSYSNYSLDECTIIAVPDALHRGWMKRAKKNKLPPVLPVPVFPPLPRP